MRQVATCTKYKKYDSKYQFGGSISDLFANQYLFQRNKSSPIVKDREKRNLYWNFNSLILSCHTWNIPKKCTKSDLQAVKIRLVCFLGMFHVWQLRIKLLKFQWRFHFPYLLQWVMIYSFGIILNSIQWQSMGHDLYFWNKYRFGNRSQFDPLPWYGKKYCHVFLVGVLGVVLGVGLATGQVDVWKWWQMKMLVRPSMR